MNKKYLFIVCVTLLLVASLTLITAVSDTNTQTNTSVTKKTDNTHTMNNIQSNKVKSNSYDSSLDTSKQTTKEKIDESDTSSENQINTDTTTSIEEKEKTVKNSINKKTNDKTVKGAQYVTVYDFYEFRNAIQRASDSSLVITIAENANFVVTDSSTYWNKNSKVSNLTIIGNGVTVNGNGHKFLSIGGDKDNGKYYTLNMTNLTIENCSTQYAPEHRGSVLYGIHVPTIYISHCTFNNCSSEQDGGAILVHRGNLTITDSVFNDISATTTCGAIRFYYNDELYGNAYMYIKNVTFTNVSSGRDGGVIYASTKKGNVDIINCTFKDSGINQTTTSTPKGGAVYVDSVGHLNVTDTVFENINSSGKGMFYIENSQAVDKHIFNNLTLNNITMDESSGICIASSMNVTVTDCTFTNNNATNGGGVITLLESVSGSYVYNNTFINNTAEYGAAIHASGVVTSVNNTFANNNATYGGAVYTFSSTSKFTGYDDIYENNTAIRGGALYVLDNSIVESNRGYFKNNTASEYGGVAFVENGGVFDTNYDVFEENYAIRGGVLYVNDSSGKKIVVSYSNFTKNNATEGGALYIEQGIVDSESEIFKDNHADIGGAIYNLGGNLTSTYNILVNNTADIGGGAYVAQGASITKFYGNDENNTALIGGAIYNNGTFVSQGSAFTTNNATTGGAIFNNGTLSIAGDVFTRNNASLGGAIYNNNTINANNNNFIGNNATNGGGLLDNGTFRGKGNNYYNNTALENGGGVYSVQNRSINLQTVRFEGNTAGKNGGAIFAEENITLTSSNDVRYINNSAVLGGAVYLSNNCTLDSYADEFRANNATYGGAIFAQANNTVRIRGASQVDSNTAEKGGAIYLNETSNLNLVNSLFTNNNATEGSVVYANSGNNVISSGSTYENNTATTGTIYLNENVVFTSSNDKFINNVATDKGGAIYTKSNITTSNDLFDSNNATFGGAIYLEQNLAYNSLKDTFESNRATISGGVLYVEDNSVVNVTEDMFDLNNAVNGGAIFLVGNSNLNSTRTTYRKNDAEEGGAVYVPEEAEVNTTGDEFNGNKATVGGVFYNLGNINSTGTTYSNSYSTDKGSVIYNAPQATFTSENDQFKSNDGITGSVIYNDGKATVTQSTFDSNKAVNSVIYNDNELTLNGTNFKNNYITGAGNYVIYNNKDTATIVNSLFVNNTNDTHDILLGGVQPANIRDNSYIDNYLNDTMTVPELIEVDSTQAQTYHNMTVNLRSIYNDTIRNGTITFKDSEGNIIGEGIVNNGNATVTIFNYRLPTGYIPVNVTYKSFDKHYQDINLTTTIMNPGSTSVVVTGIDPTYVDDKFNATVSLYNSTFGYIYNQNVTVYINGTKYVGNTTDKGYFVIEDLSFNRYGVYPINATFNGTSILMPSSVNTSITIMKIPTHLVLNLPENITHPDDTGVINVTLYDSRSNTALANKNITLNITYKELYISTTNETGSINYTFVARDRGNVDVSAFAPIESDVKYATPDEVMGRFVINRYSPHFHFTVTQIEHPEVANDVNITFTLYDEYHNLIPNKNVTLYIENSTGSFEVNVTTNATGEIMLKQTVLANGDVNVTAVSVEDYKYREGSLPVHVQADIIYTFLAVTPSNTYVNNSNEIVIHFQDISGDTLNGKVNLTVGEYGPVEVDIENGVLTYKNDSMTWDHAQEIRVSVSFAGNNTHQASSSNSTFTVFRIPTNTTIAVLQNLNTESIFEINVTANQTIYAGNVNYGTINIYANKTIDDQTTELITLAEGLSLVGTDGHIIFSTDKLEDIARYRIIVQYNMNDVFFESSAITAMGTTSYKNTTIIITATTPILVNQTDTMEFVLRETQNNNRLPLKNITITVNGPDGYIMTYENLTTDDLGRVLVDERFENVGVYNITATFDGDTYYNKTISLANITVRQKTITIVSVVSPIHVYDNITCIITLTDISGNPLANQEIYVTDNDREGKFITNASGQYSLEDIYYTSGLKNITARFMGTDLYITSEGYDIILVQRLDTILSIKADSPVYVGNQTVISGYLTLANGTGIKGQTVYLTINGQDSIPIVTGEDGNYTYNYTTKPNEIGINNVTVEFKQDNVYYGFVDKTVFKVDDIITIVTVGADRLLKVGNTTVITGVLEDQFGNRLLRQEIDIYINGEKVDQLVRTNNSGVYQYAFTPTTAGIYNVLVNYTGNTTHTDSHADYRIKVDKIITHMDLYSTTPINVGEKINVNGKLYDEFDQPLIRATVSLLVNGTYIENTTTLADGTFSFTYDATTVGIQNITVVYNGTEERYLPTNNTHQSNVLKIFTHFDDVEATNVKVDQNTTVTGILIDENGLPMNNTPFNITFNDGEPFNYTTDDNGRFTIYYNATVVGLNNLTLDYYGSETHTPVSLDAIFNVDKLDVYLDTNVTELTSRNATLTINVTDENGEQVREGFIFIYDENDVEIGNGTVLPSGKAVLNISVTPGLHNVQVFYNGTEDRYKTSNQVVSLNVPKHVLNLTLEVINNTKVRNTTNITGFLYDLDNNPVKGRNIEIYVNGDLKATVQTGEDGNYTYEYTAEISGLNEATAVFVGDEDNATVEKTGTFTVEKINTTIVLNQIADTTVDYNITVTGTLKDEFEFIIPDVEVIISINGINYTNTTGSNGEFSFVYTTSVVGINNVTVYYNGNNTYNNTQSNITVNILPHTTKVTAAIPDPRPRSSIIEINVTDENDKKVPTGNVVIKENDEQLATGTIVNGELITTVNLEPGEHTLLVEYEGITNYNANHTTLTVTIPRYETIIVPESVNPVKLNETIVIKGFIIDQYNVPVKDTNINISINRINVTVPVDSEGKFTYTNTTNVTGTNNITYLYEGNSTYENSSAKLEFIVLPLSTIITVNNTVPVLINNNTTIEGVLTDEKGNKISNAQVEIWLNDKLNTTVTTDTNGKYNHTVTVDTLGGNKILVKYLGNSSYNPTNATTVFYVGKVNTTLSINKTEEYDNYNSLAPGDTVYFNVTLKDQYGHILPDKNVTLIISNSTEEVARIQNTTDSNGISHYHYVPPEAGNYNIYALFNGTEDPVFLTNSSEIITIEPHKIPTEARMYNQTVYSADTSVKFDAVLFHFIDPQNPDPVNNNITIANQEINITMWYKDGTNETKTYHTDENGAFVYEFTKAEPHDNFTITFDYPGNYRYKSIVFNKSFDDSITTFNTFIAKYDHVRINETNLLTYFVHDELDRPVNGTLNLTNETGDLIAQIPVKDGYAYYNYSSEKAKHVKVTALFYNDTVNYNRVPQTLEFDVFKIDSVINMTVHNNTVFNTTIEINVVNPYNETSIVETGDVTIKIGDNEITRQIQDGSVNITLTDMEAKIHDISLSYAGNEYFYNSTNTSSVEVVKVPVTVVPQVISNYTTDFVVLVQVNYDNVHIVNDGIVTLYDKNGNVVGTAPVTNGRATIYNDSISQRPAEEFKAVFNESKYFIDNNGTVTTGITKYNATLTITDIVAIEVNETVEINVTLKYNNNPIEGQSILFTFSDGTTQQTRITDVNGVARISYNSTTDKVVTVTASLVENDVYQADNVSDTFIVEKTHTILNATATTPIKVGSNTTIRGRLISDTRKPLENAVINITIGENKYNTTTDSDGYYSYNITDYPVGDYDVQIDFYGNEIYHDISTQTSFTVEPHDSFIEANNSKVINGKTNITVNVTDENFKPANGGFVNITENGVVIGNGTINSEGILETNLTLTPGRHKLDIAYNGTENYTKADTVLNIMVPKYEPVIILNEPEPDVYVRNNTTLSGYLFDENDEAIKDATLIIRVNDIEIATVITGEDGNYSVVYNATTIGEKNVSVIFEGNEVYAPTEATGEFNVIPIHTNVTVPEIANTTIGNVVLINGTLTDELEQVVGNVELIITINGKNYTTSTDADGKYEYNYTTGIAGVNNITVTFIGDNNILGTVNETTFNVTKIATTTVANITEPRAGTNVIDINVTETLSGLNVTNGNLEVRDENDAVVATGKVINGTSVIAVGGLESGKEYEFKVVYNGTNVYENSSSTFKVMIPNSKINIIPDPVNTMKIGEYTDITGILVDENNKPVANTLVNVTVDGNKLEVRTNDSGRYAYPYTANKTGNITVNVTVEQEGYDTASVEFNFTVVPVYTQVTAVAASPIIVTNNTTISGVLTDEYGVAISGVNVTIFVNGAEVANATTGTDGDYTYNYTTSVVGLNNVTVKYLGNNTHTPSNATANFIVEQMLTAISVETVTPIKVGMNTTINGTLIDRTGAGIVGATINISVGNDEYEYTATTAADGTYTINVTDLLEGNYIVKVLFNGTEVYIASNNTARVIVEKYEVNVDLNITEPKAGINTVNINLTDEFGDPVTEGNVTLLDKDGNFLGNATIGETGLVNVDVTLEPGVQNITVVYNGTNKYLEGNATFFLNIPRYDVTLTLNNVNDTIVRNTTNISGQLLDGETPMAGSVVDIIINGIVVGNATVKDDGVYEFVYNAVTVGDKNVTVLYKGTDEYAETSVNDTFNVGPIHTNVTVPEIANTTIGNVVLINGTLTDELEQVVGNVELIITINGKNYTVSTDADGKYAYSYTTGTSGENSVTVTFVGDNNILGTSNSTTFNVTRIATTTVANITTPRAGTNIIDINVTETQSGLNVTNGDLEIRDENDAVVATGKVINGTSVIAVGDLESGKEYEFKVVYNGTNVYENSSYKFNVKIPDHTLYVIPDPVPPVDVGETVNITGKIVDENNKPLAGTEINITVNGETTKVTTDENGTYKLPFTTNTTGINNVTVSYNAEGYNPLEENYNFTVNSISTQLTAEAVTPIIVTNNTTISGKLMDKDGKAIKEADLIVYLNNVIIDTNIKTNDNGEYTFNITGEILGINNVTVVYEGNNTYNGVNQTTNFVVQKLFTTITVETITPIKVGENTSITGKLVDINNNPVTGAIVNITIDGQKYNTTTDNKGNYEFNVTGRVLGDNNVTVLYEGSIVYTQTNNTGKFIVEKHNTDLTVEVAEPKAGNSTINVTVTDETGNPIPGGFVNITDENGNVIGNGTIDENGNLITNITLEPGKHEITVTYNGTDDNEPANKTIRIEIPPYETNITVSAKNTEVRNTTEIRGVLESEGKKIADADIVIYVGTDKFTTQTNSEGEYSIDYDAKTAGQKQVTVEYVDQTGKYARAENATTFEVTPINSKVVINPLDNIKVGNVTNITGTVTDYKDRPIPNAMVNITINGVNYTVQANENGEFSQEYVGSIVGQNNVIATYAGDNNFNANESKAQFTVSKIDSNIEAESVASSTGVNIIEVNVTDENDENIPFGPVYITDEDGNVIANGTIINGTVRVPVPTQPGDNKFKVVYNGTDKYTNATKDLTVTVPKYGVIVTPDPIPPVTIGETVNITGKIIDENNQPVRNTSINVTINGENITVKTDENGTYNVPYTTTTAGINNVTVALPENENYTSTSTESNFTVNKKTVIINPETPSVISGEPTVINGTIIGEDGKPVPGMKVNITINGENVTVTTDENGTYTHTHTFTTPGESNITITAYDEKGEYEPQTEEYTLSVDRKTTQTIFDTPGTIKIGDKATITGQLLDDKGEPLVNADVTVTVGDKKVTVKTDKNGRYTAQVTPTTMGTNNITVTYPGNNTHKPTNNTGALYVDKLDTVITSNIANASRVDDNVVISGTLKDEKGRALPNAPVTVNVNGKDLKTTTDNNGNYKVTYPSTIDGRHNVSIKYAGNGTHYPTEASRLFTLQKHDIIPGLEIVPGPGEITIVGNVTDENGEPIKDGNITITTPDGNKTVVPVKDGKVNTTIPATPGQNEIKMDIDAGDKYNPVNVPAVVDVPKINSTITIYPLKPALAGDNVTVTGTLKDAKGKALPNQKVTITCGNTTITTTTDKNGKYQAVIPNISSGNKNITVTYPGSNTYNSSTAQATQSVTKRGTVVTVDPVVGIVGENITLTAYIKDTKGAKVSGGNLVFKLNGKSLRTDGRFDSDAPAMKIKVVDGKVTITLLADLYLRNVKNLTATYSGSYRYDSNSSKVVTAQIQKRTAAVKVTATPTTVRQNKDVVFKATVTDVTKNHKNTTSINQKGYVLFKLNGNTIKATNGSTLYVPVVNSQASYTYHVPSGTGGITNDKNIRNYTVTAIYTNENFYPDNCKNTTTYNVLRSHINVTITRAVVQDGLLSVKGTIKDDQAINVVGTSKVCVKINGATYKENGAYKYFTVTDGIIDISGIKANTKTQIKTVEVVSGERQAYYAGKGSTTNVIVVS